MQRDDATRVVESQVRAWTTAYVGIIPKRVLDRTSHAERIEVWERIIRESPERSNLVVVDSEIMGWACHGKCRDEDKDSEITQELWGVYVDPAYLRSGYGQQLLSCAMSETLEMEPEEITLWVLEENYGAIAFYESNQFVLDGEKKAPEKIGGTIEARMVLKIENETR